MALLAWFPLNNKLSNIGSGDYSLTSGSSTYDTGKTATYSLKFASNQAYINNPFIGLSKWSLAFWYKPNSPATWSDIFTFSGGYERIEFSAANGANLTWYADNTTYSNICNSGTSIATGLANSTWYHIAVTFENGTTKIYLNGVLRVTQTGKTTFASGSDKLYFAGRINTNYAAINLQDIRCYNHCLSNVEIRNLNRALVLHYDFENLYTPVEYIEFTGTQFIRTGINSLTVPYRVETTFNKTNTETSDQCLFGQRQLGKFSNIYNTYFESDPLGVSASGTAPNNTKATLVVTNTSVSLSGKELISSSSVGNRSTSYEALIGAFSEDSYANAKWFFKGRIYEIKIINNGVLYRHFVPVQRTTDGKLGLLDKVNNVFYTNSGSGDFTTSTASISGKVLDCSGNGVDGTTSNISITNDVKIGTQGVTFNGSSSKIDSTILLTPNMTFACWLKFNANGAYHIIDCRAQSGETGMQPMYGGTSYGLQCYSSAGGSYTWSAATCGFTTGTWYHVAVTITSSNATLYINGVSKGTQSGSFGSNFGDRLCRLGSRCSGANWFNGSMCDVRVYNATLSASDIKELYEVRGMIDDKGNVYCDGLANAQNFNLSNTGVLKSDDISTGANNFSLCGGYTRLDYIQSTGTQYIDTGFTPNQDTKIEVKYTSQTTASGSEFVFGSRTTYNQAGISHCVNFNSKFFAQYNNVYTTVGGTYTVDKIENVTFDKNKIYFDGALNYTFTYANFTAPHSLLLFACYSANQGGLLGQSHIKMYSCKIWDNNKLVRDYIPVKRNSDNAVGMYDNVNGAFYTNSGSGTFTVGASCGSLNSISCNNFYKDGGACVADYNLTQLARASWHTMWSGSIDLTYKTKSNFSNLIPSNDNSNIRITGYLRNVYDEYGWWVDRMDFNDMTNKALVPIFDTSTYTYKDISSSVRNWLYFYVKSVPNSTTIDYECNMQSSDNCYIDDIYITKIEQYY